MSNKTLTARLHPRHEQDARLAGERRRIVARYAPSARDLFAQRERLTDGYLPKAARRARRRLKLPSPVDALRSLGDAARRAARSIAEVTR